VRLYSYVINMHSITGDEKVMTNGDLELIFDNICRSLMTLCIEGKGHYIIIIIIIIIIYCN